MSDPIEASPPDAATCTVAFKEWAAVCDALCEGKVDLILRKGGIHERRGTFRPEHDRFWLMATRFHQDAADLAPFLRGSLPTPPPEGVVRLPGLCEVVRTWRLNDAAELAALRGRHALSDETALQRFHYKEPGLWALAVQVWVPEAPVEIADSPQYGGCRSWVELPPVSAAGLRAVPTQDPR